MVNIKKILFSFVLAIILITIGIFFYWKNQQKELVSLNESLPEGIKITKTLTGDYKITNKIDGYSFKAPEIWEGIKEIEYTPKEEMQDYITSTIEIEGETLYARYVMINQFKTNLQDIELKNWATTAFNSFDLVNNFENHKIGNIDAVVTRENTDLMGMDIYFFKKDSTIYSIMSGSKDFIEEIILSGEW